ncbi:Prefoldin subunit-domain-containing protein [Radiomyces spectabilis]|uniref:Prefoldin subunit-domain-containing protein n=1 Tax=Radiomyces spectabilis TaxID=64574 RepID=UPI002220C47A|nr:Prefoldin subunit-domain-containing protein [Radiomyces spectabilis]KAI8366042.1 Prefoldin subunit-domain-containing protein [Radiomyces spectabilis]
MPSKGKRAAAELQAALKKYDDFISLTLKPNLKTVLDARDNTLSKLSDYQKLKTQIEMMQTHNLKELKTMVDLGSQFYVQAHVPDTTYIYVNVGFGFHVQFTLDEALAFIEKKEKRLESLASEQASEADKIRAHIKMVLEAMSEILRSG